MSKWNGINRVSKNRQKVQVKYRTLILDLRSKCDNRSELTGSTPDWQSDWLVEPHHIKGRPGDLLLDPFNIIMLNREEHDNLFGHNNDEVMLGIVRKIRLQQGYEEATK